MEGHSVTAEDGFLGIEVTAQLGGVRVTRDKDEVVEYATRGMMMGDDVAGDDKGVNNGRTMMPSMSKIPNLAGEEGTKNNNGVMIRGQCDDLETGMMTEEVCNGEVNTEGERGGVEGAIRDTVKKKNDIRFYTCTPSVGEMVDNGLCVSSLGGVDDKQHQECSIKDGRCINDCVVRNISYTVKKRTMNRKTKIWYDRSVKVNKLICVKKKSDRDNLANKL